MQTFKDKLYHYESVPPEGMWDKITSELDKKKTAPLRGLRGRSKLMFYAVTAAAALIIIFVNNAFFNDTESEHHSEGSVVKAVNAFLPATKDSINLNYQLLEEIINTPQSQKLLASNSSTINGLNKRYLTVAGPEGQPVKISAKAATLILSADNDYPPRPVWSDKIDKWQQIMLSNTSSPTPSGLLDIIQRASGNFE